MMYRTREEDNNYQYTRRAESSRQALGFYIDAVMRSEQDRKAHPEVFNDASLQERVEFVKELIKQFFRKTDADIYVTCRWNRGNPFISVKPKHSFFGSRTRTEKYTLLLNPIRNLGGYCEEKNTSSGWFVRVYHKNQWENHK
jgi:hypothetical protein